LGLVSALNVLDTLGVLEGGYITDWWPTVSVTVEAQKVCGGHLHYEVRGGGGFLMGLIQLLSAEWGREFELNSRVPERKTSTSG
jgi:hypothetical protein